MPLTEAVYQVTLELNEYDELNDCDAHDDDIEVLFGMEGAHDALIAFNGTKLIELAVSEVIE